MKLLLQSKHLPLTHLTDDTRLASPTCAFVQTALNAKYATKDTYPIVHAKDLPNYLPIEGIDVIGITGTNGKTTTSFMMTHLLTKMHKKVATLGTNGFYINGQKIIKKANTTPDTLQLYAYILEAIQAKCGYFIMEVSSHAIAQDRIVGIAFKATIHTNITSDHLDFHTTLSNYQATKNAFLTLKYLTPSGFCVVNADDPCLKSQQHHHTYSIMQNATLFAKDYRTTANGITATICHQDQNSTLDLPIAGSFNLSNALAALLAVAKLTHTHATALGGEFKDFKGVDGRMQIVATAPLIVIDFAHTPDGMEQTLKAFEGKNTVVVFGAGGNRDKTKRPLMGAIAERYAKRIYLTSDNPRDEDPLEIIQDIAKGIADQSKIITQPDRLLAIGQAIKAQQPEDIILILGKGDENTQEIRGKLLPMRDLDLVMAYL